jgi:hypothetical protein
MFFISKACKGHEYLYKRQFAIRCKSKKQATQLAEHLNTHNETANGEWKLNDNETWYVYEDGEWYNDYIPYKLKSTKGKISIVSNI